MLEIGRSPLNNTVAFSSNKRGKKEGRMKGGKEGMREEGRKGGRRKGLLSTGQSNLWNRML